MTLPRLSPDAGVPPQIVALLEGRNRAGWTGTIELNFKDGRIIAYEVAERHRLDQR